MAPMSPKHLIPGPFRRTARIGTSPYLRCHRCGAKRPLDQLVGEPSIILFCASPLASLICGAKAALRRHRSAGPPRRPDHER